MLASVVDAVVAVKMEEYQNETRLLNWQNIYEQSKAGLYIGSPFLTLPLAFAYQPAVSTRTVTLLWTLCRFIDSNRGGVTFGHRRWGMSIEDVKTRLRQKLLLKCSTLVGVPDCCLQPIRNVKRKYWFIIFYQKCQDHKGYNASLRGLLSLCHE